MEIISWMINSTMKILIQINIILDHFASTLEFISVDEISELLYLQLLR